MDFPVLHSNSRTNRHGLIFDLMEPFRPMLDRMLYQFMEKTTLTPKDFFETRRGICKIMPELSSQIIPLVKSLDPDINRIVKEFGSFFKTRHVRTRHDEYRKLWNTTKKTKAKTELNLFPLTFEKTKTKTELPLFPLPDESTETETLAMPEREWSAMS